MSKKIVFFFPSFASSEATAPLGILAVATPLLRAGYTVNIIDSTITPNLQEACSGRSTGRAVPGYFPGDRADDSRDCRDREVRSRSGIRISR